MARKKDNGIWALIEKLKNAKGVSELIINSADSVFIERRGEMSALDIKFKIEDVNFFIQDVVNYNKRPFDEKHPVFDGVLPMGYRINMISPLYTGGFPAITIRRYDKYLGNLKEACEAFSIEPVWEDFFEKVILGRKNFIISGGTGTGKTTLMNSFLNEIPDNERLVTIEDTRELNFSHPNLVHLESKVSMGGLNTFDLVKNALRMRPDRIIVGEVRGGEIFDLFQAMNTGHDGSMSTIHANSTRECLMRMENLFYFGGVADIPLIAIRYQMVSALSLIIQLKRTKDGKRVVSQVSELTQMEGDRITMSEIGVWDTEKQKLRPSGIVPSFMGELIQLGLSPSHFNR